MNFGIVFYICSKAFLCSLSARHSHHYCNISVFWIGYMLHRTLDKDSVLQDTIRGYTMTGLSLFRCKCILSCREFRSWFYLEKYQKTSKNSLYREYVLKFCFKMCKKAWNSFSWKRVSRICSIFTLFILFFIPPRCTIFLSCRCSSVFYNAKYLFSQVEASWDLTASLVF